MSSLQFLPAFPWPVLAILASLASAPALLAVFLHVRGAWLRLAGVLLVIAALSGPRLLAHKFTPLPDVAVILVDHSQSMDIGARHAMAARALASLRASAGATQLEIIDVPPSDTGGTALAPALAQALATIQPNQLAGIVAITDGEVSDTPDLTSDTPITALLTASGEETDRELRLLATPSYGLAGQNADLGLEVFDHGLDDAGAAAQVTVAEDGATVANLAARIGVPLPLELPVRHAGPIVVTATVSPLAGEVSAINDQAAFTLTGINKRLNVLLISGFPDQGERAWRLLLKSDPAVQLVHFTILRTPEEPIDVDPRDLALVPFPVRALFETDIAKFNLIILDGFNAADVLPSNDLGNIAGYVQHGGALLTETGPEFNAPDSLAFSPLAPVIPATPEPGGSIIQPFAPRITALGARHPVTAPFAGMTLPPWFRMQPATATSGDVLMTGADNLPLLVLANAGSGRVGVLLSDQLWLWTRGGAHTGPALPLLRRIVHWLLREPALDAEALNLNIADHRLTISRQTLASAYPGDAMLTAPNGQEQRIALKASSPGNYTASLKAGASGVWKVSEGNLTAYAANNDNNTIEFQDLAATAQNLSGVARNIVWLGKEPAPALSTLITPRHATQITSTSSIPLFPPIPTLAAALAFIIASWWRESRTARQAVAFLKKSSAKNF